MTLDMNGLALKDIEQLDAHYHAAVAFWANHQYMASDQEWDAFGKLIDSYIDQGVWLVEDENFEDYMATLEGKSVKLKDDIRATLKSLYNRAIGFEQAYRFKDAEKVWQQFNDLLNRHLNII